MQGSAREPGRATSIERDGAWALRRRRWGWAAARLIAAALCLDAAAGLTAPQAGATENAAAAQVRSSPTAGLAITRPANTRPTKARPANARPTKARGFVSPDVFVLGDSQITFGAGPVLLDFFENLNARCAAAGQKARTIGPEDGSLRVGVLGVRSTAIHSWVARSGRGKSMVCTKDKTWGVNAGAFGQLSMTGKKWEQIGEDPHNQFCAKGRSPFEEMFAGGYYDPKLFVMFFLGNASGRWAGSKKSAVQDVKALTAQLPADTRCLMITTAPSYKAKHNKRRQRAQDNIKAAFEENGRRCTVVSGFTPQTIGALQGQPRFFRRNKSGAVKDPFHPNRAGAKAWLAKMTPALCRAVASAWPAAAAAAAAPARGDVVETAAADQLACRGAGCP